MIEKELVISILEDIKEDIKNDNTGEKAIKTINTYIKNLKLAIDPHINDLIEEQKKIIESDGEESEKLVDINKEIDDRIREIFNEKI